MPQGVVEGPCLCMLAMLPLISWIAQDYPQVARAPHTSQARANVDDAVPMARDEKAKQVVQGLMQSYRRINHLVWSAEESVVLRRGGKGGMTLGVGDGLAWLERAEEAVVLGHVQAMWGGRVRLPEKLLSGFRAMLMVIWNRPPLVQTTLRAVLNAAIGYQGMHILHWRGQLEEVEGEERRLIREYEGIPKELPCCVLRSPTAYYGEGMPTAGEAYRAHTAEMLNRMCHNQEEVVRRVCYHAVTEVQTEENMCQRYVWHRRRRLATGKKEPMWPVYLGPASCVPPPPLGPRAPPALPCNARRVRRLFLLFVLLPCTGCPFPGASSHCSRPSSCTVPGLQDCSSSDGRPHVPCTGSDTPAHWLSRSPPFFPRRLLPRLPMLSVLSCGLASFFRSSPLSAFPALFWFHGPR